MATRPDYIQGRGRLDTLLTSLEAPSSGQVLLQSQTPGIPSIHALSEWFGSTLTDDDLCVYCYLITHFKVVEMEGQSYRAVQVSQNRIADESLRAYYPHYRIDSLRKKVGIALGTLERCGVITRIKSDQWKQVNIYLMNPCENWRREVKQQSPAHRRNLIKNSSASPSFPSYRPSSSPSSSTSKVEQLPLILFGQERENNGTVIHSDPTHSDPTWITRSRSGVDHDLCLLEGESLYRDPPAEPLKPLTEKNRDPKTLNSPIRANIPSAPSPIKTLPAAGSWSGEFESFDGLEANWAAFEPEGLAFLHPDVDWFWQFLLAGTYNQNERAQGENKGGIGCPQKYAEAIARANGHQKWHQFEQTVTSWQQFAYTLDWQYVQGNLRQFTYALEKALSSPNHVTQLGAGWLIVHNIQWGVTVSAAGKVQIDPVVWEQVSSRLSLIQREFERLEMGERAIQTQLLAHLGTGQLTLLTQDQLQEWLTYLRLQSSPADAAQALAEQAAQAERMQQIALQVATDRVVKQATSSSTTATPSTQTVERSQLEIERTPAIPSPPTPVAREEGEEEKGREEKAQTPTAATSRPLRKPIIQRRVIEAPSESGVSSSKPTSLYPVAVVPEPQDFSDVLMAIRMAVQHLGWNQRQVQEALRVLFKADLKQDQLTDGQLEDWLDYLQEQIGEITKCFKECWNQHKPQEFAPIDVITYERKESIMRLVQELGGIEQTCEILASGLAYPTNDPFWKGKNIPFDKACPHIVEWHEQRLATENTPTPPPKQEYVSAFDQLSPEEKAQYTRQYANDPSWMRRDYRTDGR